MTTMHVHCDHWQEGDGDCCVCKRPNWCPEEGVTMENEQALRVAWEADPSARGPWEPDPVAPEEILRARLIAALRSVETAAPRLQVPYGAMVDAILALGDLESRWEIRGGSESDDADDRWFSFADSREDADRVAAKDPDAQVFALYALRFTPIGVEQGGAE